MVKLVKAVNKTKEALDMLAIRAMTKKEGGGHLLEVLVVTGVIIVAVIAFGPNIDGYAKDVGDGMKAKALSIFSTSS